MQPDRLWSPQTAWRQLVDILQVSPAATPAGASGAGLQTAKLEPGGRLDLKEGICDPRPAKACQRWPEFLFLLSSQGEVVQGCCKATNLCVHARERYVMETVEMLLLDAMEYAPTLWVVLTAREHLTRRDTYAHLRQLLRSGRVRWPALQWFVQVEFQRRGALHLNLLIKGVPVEQRKQLLAVLSGVWCSRVDALPAGQCARAVNDGQGLVRYLNKTLSHGLKAEQAPPIGWRGHRTSQTRGYLVRPAAAMREEAREAIRQRRARWKATRAGLDAHDVELVVHQALELAAATTWRLWRSPRPKPAPPRPREPVTVTGNLSGCPPPRRE